MVKNICRLYIWVFFLGTMLAFSSCQNEQQKNLLSEDAINGSVSEIYSNAVAPLYNYIGKDSLETSDADPLYHICHGAFLLTLSFFLKVFSLWHVTPPVSSVRPSLTSNESPYTLNPKITFWEKQLNFQHTFPYIITALDAFPCRLSRILPNHIFLC